MSTKHDIDNLFANKLSGAQVEPSAAAWDSLNQKLQANKSSGIPTWLKIAASVTLILGVSGFFIFNNSGEEQQDIAYKINSSMDYPQMNVANADFSLTNDEQKEFAVIYNSTQKKNIEVMQPVKEVMHLPTEMDQIAEHKEEIKEPVQLKALDEYTAAETIARIEEPVTVGEDPIKTKIETVDIKEVALPSVTITYSGAEAVAENTPSDSSKMSLKKVFAEAKRLKNGGLMADLRGAKENLFSNGKKLFNN